MKTFEITMQVDDEMTKEAIEKSLDIFKYKIIKIVKKRRSDAQNRALHLYFTKLAKALNDAGWDMKKTLKEEISIDWSSYSVKENIWRPLQKSKLGKVSTTQLKTNDIDKIYDIINREIGGRTGVSVPFPCEEELYYQDK